MSRSQWQTGPNGERAEVGIFEHEGRECVARGALVTPTYAVGYPAFKPGSGGEMRGSVGEMRAWDGTILGSCRIVESWPIQSWQGSRMYQIEATIDGVTYTGRGFGESMLWRGKRKAGR